ncbi:DNA glycosylase [Hypomontagnella monticulosa]|nr:DNA glycosylase [Hypomontagnella monticulosa]
MRRSSRITRQSASVSANKTLKTESLYFEQDENIPPAKKPRRSTAGTKKRTTQPKTDASDSGTEAYVDEEDDARAERPVKRRKVATRPEKKSKSGNTNEQLHTRLFAKTDSASTSACNNINFPGRTHKLNYHRPLLLDNPEGRAALLTWFDGVSEARGMPWRKPWIDPDAQSRDPKEDAGSISIREKLERRAYEVWISEIMLQQTRVAAVIEYWSRWMAKWPSIHELAKAQPDEVLAAWRGLGYYSRATRIHDAAKIVCEDPEFKGLLPRDVEELVKRVPGVGRYTAGAISAIVFGEAVPMVDGNVLRVLSRQLGIFGDAKTDKAVIDVLWAAADRLVKAVARDGGSEDANAVLDTEGREEEEPPPSDRPGRWGQALMELGSTICTPKPNCASCPITASCHAYAEGLQLAAKKGLAPKPTISRNTTTDIEDACMLCKPFGELEDNEEQDSQNIDSEATPKHQKSRSRIQATLQSFAFTTTTSRSKQATNLVPTPPSPSPTLSAKAIDTITNHARKFPLRAVKKAVREEETLVCAIHRSDGRFLIHRRPEKGLLAGLWELPSYILEDPKSSTSKTRARDAEMFVKGLTHSMRAKGVKHVRSLGDVPWLFSHLKLTMHVHLFELDGDVDSDEDADEGTQSRWCDVEALDAESMGTGMRKCWALVKEACGG